MESKKIQRKTRLPRLDQPAEGDQKLMHSLGTGLQMGVLTYRLVINGPDFS